MSQAERINALMAAFHKTTYFRWMAKEGIPVVDGYGVEPARHLALRYGTRIHPIGFKIDDKRSEDGVYIDVKQGGTLIEYADEDPYIRQHYEEECRKTGVKSAMPTL